MKIALYAAALAALLPAPAVLAQTEPVTAAATAKFNLDTPIEAIVADEKAKAVLDADLPGVSTHQSYDMFKAMSLKQLSAYAADKLTPEVLAKVEKDLAAIK
ncbi:hypothetical protein [Sphingomonas sp.]|uniref:hypothetical protein n=1 Tax=Sphingomonas sp. TaxID=28214 RepID=UPI001EB2592B|nr:hypothetical protein [Sphingomonas sp.]MBX3594781.1 hypothetical protein [Sphingomonas sp.]